MDRIDIYLEASRIEYEKLPDRRPGEMSAKVRERVQAARERQAHRFKVDGILLNSDIGRAEIRDFCRLDNTGEQLIQAAGRHLLGHRQFRRPLRLRRRVLLDEARRRCHLRGQAVRVRELQLYHARGSGPTGRKRRRMENNLIATLVSYYAVLRYPGDQENAADGTWHDRKTVIRFTDLSCRAARRSRMPLSRCRTLE
jgi:hypothetical protein